MSSNSVVVGQDENIQVALFCPVSFLVNSAYAFLTVGLDVMMALTTTAVHLLPDFPVLYYQVRQTKDR